MNQEEIVNDGATHEENNPQVEETTAAAAPVEKVEDVEDLKHAEDSVEEESHEATEDNGESVKKVEAEEDHENPKERKLIIPDFDVLSTDQSLKTIIEHIKQYEVARIKGVVESGRSRILMELNAERDAAQMQFIEEGGNALDFHLEQPLRKKLHEVYGQYRDNLRSYYANLEKELASNLHVKENIIEQIKALPMAEGSAKSKYETFKALREQWNATGLVPKESARNIWANYNHHVDNFFDYLRLAYDLIDKDYQHNYDAKVALCEELEAMNEEGTSANLFRTLQQAHSKWKRIGPVPREKKEELWERFKAITAKIHEKRDAFNENLKAVNDDKIAAKKAVIEGIKALTAEAPTKHSGWQKANKQLEVLRTEFKKIGFVKSSENDQVWEEYKEAQREYNNLKNQFYKEEKKAQRDNLDKKQALVDLAESLKDSDDFQETARALKKAQADWKKTGYVNKKEGDALWNAFRAACNHFFDRMNGSYKAKEAKANAVVTAKKDMLKEVEKAKVATIEDAIALSQKWSALGSLHGKARSLEDDFDALFNKKLEALGLDANELEKTIFEAKVKALVEADDQDGLLRQRGWLRDQLDHAKKELHQLENNIAFFSSSKGNPLLDAALKNIEIQKARVEHVTGMRKLFNSLLK